MANACDIADRTARSVESAGRAIREIAFQIADAACAFLATVSREVCDLLDNVATEVCNATATVSRTICELTRTIPFVGDLICLVSRTVSEVVCISTRIVTNTICIASHVVTETICLGVGFAVRTTGQLLGAAVTIVGVFLSGIAEIVCFFTAGPKTPLRPVLPPGDTTVEPLIDGHRVVPRLLADIRAARQNIHISIFLFFNDPMGQWLADELIAKASDPVNPIPVRVMFDFDRTSLGDPLSSSAKKAV